MTMAAEFENEVELFCVKRCISVAKNGSEHTHPSFVSMLRNRDDAGSKMVRFQPDGVVLAKDGVYHWEAKHATNIERDAFETYMKYVSIGCKVIVFFKHPKTKKVFCSMAENIVFVPSEEVVSRYSEQTRHPIIDGWMYPRRGNGGRGYGSGTPYREVNFDYMCEIVSFYEVIQKTPSAVTPRAKC